MLPKPRQVHHKSNLSALHRLPLVHLDPDPMRLVWLKPGPYHHPLKLSRILPFLQLHRSETAAYPAVKIPEKHAEFLDSEIRNPAPQVHIQLFKGLSSLRSQPVESLPSRASESNDKVVRLEYWIKKAGQNSPAHPNYSN